MGPGAVRKEPKQTYLREGGRGENTHGPSLSVHWACAVKTVDRGKTVEAELTSFLP